MSADQWERDATEAVTRLEKSFYYVDAAALLQQAIAERRELRAVAGMVLEEDDCSQKIEDGRTCEEAAFGPCLYCSASDALAGSPKALTRAEEAETTIAALLPVVRAAQRIAEHVETKPQDSDRSAEDYDSPIPIRVAKDIAREALAALPPEVLALVEASQT